MASIEKTKDKRGVAYRIIVSAGYDQNYKKIRRIKNWRPPEGMSENGRKRKFSGSHMSLKRKSSRVIK